MKILGLSFFIAIRDRPVTFDEARQVCVRSALLFVFAF